MDNKTKLIIAAASVLVASGAAYLIGKRVLKADTELWEQPLDGTTKVEKLIIVEEK